MKIIILRHIEDNLVSQWINRYEYVGLSFEETKKNNNWNLINDNKNANDVGKSQQVMINKNPWPIKTY